MQPILAALKHHKTAVILIALEIALTCAIVSNALYLIGNRVAAMRLSTGIADDQLLWLQSSGLRADADAYSELQADLAALRAMPGVQAAVQMNSLPLSNNGEWRNSISLQPGRDKPDVNDVALYAGTPGFVGALGLHLIQGRDFLPQEYGEFDMFSGKPPPSSVIISRALAQRLWPDKNPLQQAIYMGSKGKNSMRVVGVVEHLLNPSLHDRDSDEYNLLLPVKSTNGKYVLRAPQAQRDRILRDAPAALDKVNPDRIITDSKTMTQSESDYFRDDRSMVWLLLIVVGCLLALAALGVVGLSSFWVQQRTRQIGIRRAIGATRRDILRYFQIENLLIVTLGIVIGSLSAVGLNLWLMKHYELPHLPVPWLGVGALVLWLLGQLAVLGPALRAASVPPVVATRSI